MLRTAFLIARKDLRQRVRDRSVFIYGILAPFGLALIFNVVLGPIERATFHATYAVANEDNGPIASAFLGVLDELEDEDIATIREVDSVSEARKQVKSGSEAAGEGEGENAADAAFVIPAGLSDALGTGSSAQITVVGGEGAPLASQVALSVAEGFATEVGAVELAVRTVIEEGETPDPVAIDAITREAARTPSPISVEDLSAEARMLKQTTYLAAGMSVFFLFFTVSFGVSGLLEERKIGTLNRLLCAPIDRRAVILAKAMTSYALGLVSMTVLIVATTFMLGAQWGNPLGVALLVMSVVFAAMGILAVVAATARTQAQAESFQAIISLVLAFLGGTFFPVSQVGGWLETASFITPHAWFLRGLAELQSGQVSAVFPSVGALLLFGSVTTAVAWPFMRKALQP